MSIVNLLCSVSDFLKGVCHVFFFLLLATCVRFGCYRHRLTEGEKGNRSLRWRNTADADTQCNTCRQLDKLQIRVMRLMIISNLKALSQPMVFKIIECNKFPIFVAQ